MNLAPLISCMAIGTLCTGAASPPPSFHDFVPSRHGFAFVNHFTGSSLPGPLVLLHNALNAPDEFGLCGGMCFAAADFYLAERSIPAQTTRPTRGQPLYDYIYQRQVDSFGDRFAWAAKFSRWMDLPDTGPLSAGRATLGLLPQMLDSLGRGEPVHLGLVYVSSAQVREPWNNHQVLAMSVTLEPESDRGIAVCSLAIYDPNFPAGDAARIDIELVLERFERIGHDLSPIVTSRCTRIVPGKPDKKVRGMFPMPYAPKAPPEDLK